MNLVEIFKALSNKNRLQILTWLKEPELTFKDQQQSDFCHGVSVGLIQQKSGLTQSTVSGYLSILLRTGLLRSTRVGQWTYYERDEDAIHNLSRYIQSEI